MKTFYTHFPHSFNLKFLFLISFFIGLIFSVSGAAFLESFPKMGEEVNTKEVEQSLISPEDEITAVPDPETESVLLSYDLMRHSYMSLSIYDLSGNLIDQVPTETQYIGKNKIQWETKERAAGIYLIQLNQNGQTVATKRVILSK